MKYIHLILFLLIISTGYSQKQQIDSLYNALSIEKSDSSKVDILFKLANYFYNSDPDSTIRICEKAFDISENIGDDRRMSESLGWLAYLWSSKGQVVKSIEYNFKSLEIAERIGNKKFISRLLVNIGSDYHTEGETEEAIKNFRKAIVIQNEIKDTVGLAGSMINLGLVFINSNQLDSASIYYKNANDLYNAIGHVVGASQSLQSMGEVIFRKGDYKKALELHLEVEQSFIKINNINGLAHLYRTIGSEYMMLNNLKKAEFYALKSLELSKEIGNIIVINRSSKLLSDVYLKQGEFEKSLEYHKIHIEMRDSLINERKRKNIVKQQLNYKYEKETALSNLAHEKEMALSEEKEKRQESITVFTGIIAFVILISSFFIYNRLRLTRKQKIIIEETNEELNQVNEELSAQRDEIENQKHLIEGKNIAITDSITYAKRIQEAILPSNQLIEECFPNSFVIYKPKDIVAGDFYWITKLDNIVLFAVADCTGHGVPGALVSVVCSNALNRVVREFNLVKPSDILDKTREIIVEYFSKSDNNVKDGMDISLCSFNYKTRELQFSGANNSLMITEPTVDMEIIKGDRQAIGVSEIYAPFTNHIVPLKQNQTIYLSSDGYVDQFGGEKGKKFSSKRFKELLLSVQGKPLEMQGEEINKTFDNWVSQGSEEQIDDVCVIGFMM